MRRNGIALGLVALAAWAGAHAFGAEGQGPADAEVHIDNLRMGTYWYGQDITIKDLKGKVVLLEIWGS